MAQRLRVLFVTSWYPSDRQPVQGVFVREHAKAVHLYDDVVVLHLAGHDRRLGKMMRIEKEPDPDLTEGIPTYRAWHRLLPIPGVSYLAYVRTAMQAVRVIERQGFRPDIVHAHVYSSGLPAASVARRRRIPMVLTEHSSVFPRRLLSSRQAAVARLALALARVVMPVSLALQHGIEAYGIRATFQVVPNAVDTSVFHPDHGRVASLNENTGGHHRPDLRRRLLFVGGLVPVKGIPDLLAALAILYETHRDWQLDLVGDGFHRDEYAAMAVQLGLSEHVIFHGRKPKSEVAAFMRQADCLVLPSLWENSPCVIIEAMASGLPVVASRVGGIPELVTERTGLLVPPQAPPLLAAALALALDDPGQFDRSLMVQAAERFAPAVVGQEIDAVYRGVIR
jgi:glycosyltransferase involved in cell wall biosynthesis